VRGLEPRVVLTLLIRLSALGWLSEALADEKPRAASNPQFIVNPAAHMRYADRAMREKTRREEAAAAIKGIAEGR
jgi:hypothetical protein